MAGFGATLATKLIPPSKRSGLIPRAHLLRLIEGFINQKLLLACAPAGYGKTSTLGQAYLQFKAIGRNVGWISLDENDKDLSAFVGYFVEAARRAGLCFRRPFANTIGSGVNLPPDALKALLLNELVALDQDLFLFLDDYHLVADLEIRDLVNTLLLSPLHSLHLLIATRTHNDLPLSRLRAQGEIFEIDIADLSFSEHEVGEFVGRISGVQLSQPQVQRLRIGTEGWPASLQMAGIALHGSSNVDRFLDQFSGEHKSVGDFLGEEVFRRQTPDLQQFLMATSILQRFNCSLADALLERTDGWMMIEEIERRNLLVFSLDPEHRWHRYHHLFSDFLRRRLRDLHPEKIAGYHQRASDWFAEHRFMTDAIEHAFGAENAELAGQLLDTACGDLFATGQTATLMSLSARLPRQQLDRLPRLQLERAWQNELSWRFDDARAELERVRAVLADRKPAAGPSIDAEQAFLQGKLAHRELMLALLSDDIPKTAQLAQAWLHTDRTGDHFMCASAGSAIMASNRELFRCEGVATSTRMLHDRFVEGGARYGIVFHQSIAGATFFARGDLDHAHEAYETALQTAIELHGERSALYNMPALMLAELYYERNQLRLAEETLAQRDVVSDLGFVDNLIAGFLTSARLMALRGRQTEADSLLEEGQWFSSQRGFSRLHAAVLNERVRQHLLTGKASEAQRLINGNVLCASIEAPPEPGESSTTGDWLRAIIASRMMLAEGRDREAAPLLKLWYGHARRRHCYRAAIATGTLLARVLAAGGGRRAAQRTLLECLQMGEPGRFMRSIIDEGAEVLVLLGEMRTIEAGPADDYLAALLGASENPDDRPVASSLPDQEPSAASQELLSQRELQILSLAAQGNQNQDIAMALCLAESTIKWYWQRIFDKLDVRRRPDAIKRARQNQWIT